MENEKDLNGSDATIIEQLNEKTDELSLAQEDSSGTSILSIKLTLFFYLNILFHLKLFWPIRYP